MGQIREECITQGLIAEVLNDATAVRESMSLPQLLRGERRKAPNQDRDDGRIPGEVDQLLVG